MNNLISAQEAFNAVVGGKHVLCRAAGELMDFDDLDQFPATIFAKPGYEFCIKIETIEVAGITFTKPLTLDEIKKDQDVFIVQVDGVIHHHKYKGTHSLIATAVNGGFAQRDFDNAKLQYEALCKVLGGMPLQANVRLIEPTSIKAPRKTKAKEVVPATTNNVQITASNDVVIEAFKATTPDNVKIETSGEIIVKQDNLVSFDSVKADMKTEKSLRDRIAAAEKIEDLEALLPELQMLHGESGHNVMTAYEQKSQKLKDSESLDIGKLKELTLAAEESISEVQRKSNTLQASFQTEITRSQNVLTVENVLSSIGKNEDLTTEHKANLIRLGELRKKDIINAEYDEKLDDLMYRASIAKTPAEANAQIKYTHGWTETQLAPLHRAIGKRLSELNEGAVIEPAPSLLRDIQNAADLTTLDALEIDVSARAPDMQKTLMAEVVKRRFELENS